MLGAFWVGLGTPSAVVGQSGDAAVDRALQAVDAAVDASTSDEFGSFTTGLYGEMTALMEVTILRIDVVVLTVRVSSDTETRLRALAGGREYSDQLADSVAAIMLEAEDAWARQVFQRDVSLARLTQGIRETTDRAAEAGFIERDYADEFAATLPDLFGFLESRGAKEGDAIYLRVLGNEVRTIYRTRDGQVLLDQVGTSAEGRRASIPSFFAPGTRFRKRLVESLLAPAKPTP